ncbi:hypothetical protein BJX76DRAFT_360066 [Aspergillus varians]
MELYNTCEWGPAPQCNEGKCSGSKNHLLVEASTGSGNVYCYPDHSFHDQHHKRQSTERKYCSDTSKEGLQFGNCDWYNGTFNDLLVYWHRRENKQYMDNVKVWDEIKGRYPHHVLTSCFPGFTQMRHPEYATDGHNRMAQLVVQRPGSFNRIVGGTDFTATCVQNICDSTPKFCLDKDEGEHKVGIRLTSSASLYVSGVILTISSL